ncbi:MAG: diaminopimelate decarboxylase [Peptococcaceae bacterium]|nr:diaminopimelate decarboxylase [Peptococcaceae bacterium]
MKKFGTMRVNELDHLEIGGCDTLELIREFGSPLYVVDEDLVRKNCRKFRENFIDAIPGGEVAYASKAFTNLAMIRIIVQEGLGVDVVSAGELYTALAAGADPARIDFNGNNKTPEEIRYALENKVGRIIVDNFTEIEMIEKIAGEMGAVPKVLLRTQPGIEAHTHEYIQTGKIDSKFGLSVTTGQAMEALRLMSQSKNMELVGIHCHIGSQIFEVEPFVQAAKIMVGFMAYVRDALGVTLKELNLGGGFGIYYNSIDTPTSFKSFSQAMYDALREEFQALDFPHPSRISVEPGRSIIGNAGTTLYTVGTIKTIPRVRTYVAVDGGMTDNPRPALYQAKYEMALANKMSATDQIVASIAGKCCESGDMLIWDTSMPWVETGDILAVASTGAYNYSMSSNYNRLPRPGVVLVREGKAQVIVERETFADLIRNDRIPEHLK